MTLKLLAALLVAADAFAIRTTAIGAATQGGVAMCARAKRLRLAALFVACLLLSAGRLEASAYAVTINSPGLSSNPAVLAFDFLDGGPPGNSVTLGPLTSNGTQVSTSTSGDVTGGGPWTFTDSQFFNELLVTFNPLGSALSFSFSTTDWAPIGASPPDAFSFFILGTDLVTPLITTNDPTGSNTLFQFDLGQGAHALRVFQPSQSGFSLSVTSQVVPEPGSFGLIAAALAVLSMRRPKSSNR